MAAEYGETLSERELEIIRLVSEGLTNREIAAQLFLSPNTVKVHLRNVFSKTGVASRTELSMLAIQEGWITVPGVSEGLDAPDLSPPSTSADAEPAAESTRGIFPIWPWQRWTAVAAGLLLAIGILILPQRRLAPVTATGPGEVFGVPGTVSSLPPPNSNGVWHELAPLPVREAGMASASLDGTLFVIGGMGDGGPSGRVDIYSIESNEWTEGLPRPVELAHVAAAPLGNRILVPGGCDQEWTPSSLVHLYDPVEDTWSEAAPLPVALCAYGLATYEGRAFLFGGWDGQEYRALAYVYDPEQNVWQALAAPDQARGFGSAATLIDHIFYVGGFDGRREWATCEVYLPASDRWESCASMLQPRGGLSLVANGGRLYAIGGGWTTPLGFNERYTPAADEWTVVETPIVGEWRNLSAVAWDTSIYATGGWSGTDFLNRTYAVEIMPWRVFIPGTFRAP